MNKFGEVVKALRLADKIEAKDLAKRARIRPGYLSSIENGKTNPPSVKIIGRLHKAFEHRGIQLADLVELAWADKAPELIHERVLHKIRDNPLFKVKLVPQEIQVPVAAGEKEAV